jgi:hypothetical protein
MAARVGIHRTPEAAIVAPHHSVHRSSLGSRRRSVEEADKIARTTVGSRSMVGCMMRVHGRVACVPLPTRCPGRVGSLVFVFYARRCSWDISV